jgi:hypothetical protein
MVKCKQYVSKHIFKDTHGNANAHSKLMTLLPWVALVPFRIPNANKLFLLLILYNTLSISLFLAKFSQLANFFQNGYKFVFQRSTCQISTIFV